jgi:hypothetical protein
MHSPRIFQEDRRETYSTEAAKTRSICAPLFWKTKVRKSSLFQSKDEPEGSEGYPPSLFPYLHCSWTGESRPTMERCDAGFREIVFAPFCNGLSERTFETH